MTTATIAELQQKEIDFWRNDEFERPGPLTFYTLQSKVHEAVMFISLFDLYREHFRGRILELGAGQGWASCLVKKFVPDAHVTATDIGPEAVDGMKEWEQFWSTKIDCRYACRASATREPDASMDLVFCFASAHHFVEHDAVLAEIRRVLKPSGKALFLAEPTCPALFHPLMHWRANRIRSPEDLLIPSRVRASAERAGLSMAISFWPQMIKRGALSAVYYSVLGQMPRLATILPCTANVVLSPAA